MRTGYATVALGALAATMTAWGLVACESTPRVPVEVAQGFAEERAVVEAAEAQADVVRYASPEIGRARDYLSRAEARAAGHGPDAVATHYAYLAARVARIAELRAQEQAARARMRANELERERMLLETRLADERRARGAALMSELIRELRAAPTTRGLVITLDEALFDKGRAKLHPDAARPIDLIARFLGELPERRVQVEAFTDSVGAPSFNLELSQSRADAIAMAFIERGIDAARVRALGYGEWFAAPENAAPRKGPPDRRVEVILSHDEGVIPVLLPVVSSLAASAR
jgi:outer membrane protein OmpA-like peptidoglycan-associated protein